MKNRIIAVKRQPVPGGTEISVLAQSARGTRYVSGSYVVLHEEGARSEHRGDFYKALVGLLASA